MSVKKIAADAGKVDNISFGHGSFVSNQGITYFNLFKIFSERMNHILTDSGAGQVSIHNMSKRSGRTLQGSSLHIMLHSANAAHLFSSSGSSRAAMNEMRQRRTMACALRSTMTVDDNHAPMHRCRAKNKLFSKA